MAWTDEQKRRLAAGPYGLLTTRFALQFGKAVFFGPPPPLPEGKTVYNGTITFVDFGKGPLGITYAHVIEGFRERRAENPRIIFQFGHCEFDPLERLIGEDTRLDLATIDLKGKLDEILTKEAPGNQC